MARRTDFWYRFLWWLAGRKVYSLLLAVLLLVPLGTIGYMLVADLSLVDALYQTMITITTVGYGDLSGSGAGRVFSIIFMTIGVGAFVVTLSAVAAVFIEERLREAIGRQRMERAIQELKDHIILCGYGRFGQITADELLAQGGVEFALLDTDRKMVELADTRGILALEADATEEESLQKAGLDRARGIITTLSSDAANVYVALTAKQLRPDVPIVTLAREANAAAKLRAAGADYVVSPYNIGARSMASHILRPHVTQFVDQLGGRSSADSAEQTEIHVRMEEVAVRAGSSLVGKALKDTPLRREFGLIVVAVVKSREGDVHYSPGPDLVVEAGDVLVCVGPEEGLKRATAECASPPASA
jgi:voltage-gated potassium channel